MLAAVPGTDEANEAIVLASIPETARVSKKELKAPDVAYQGEPQYQLIDGTMVSRAVNTDKDIIKVGDLYYMCFQAVWFVSTTPNGPWEVATSIPKEIYTIPASSASHHVTYVTIEEDDDDTDEWVTFAYVAGYTGMMVAYGCVVWGSGWYYPPYSRLGRLLSGLLPLPAHVRHGRLVQPVDRRLRSRGWCVWSVRWRHGGGTVTTRAPERTRAAQPRMVRTAAAPPRRPITRARERTRPRARGRTCTATGDRATCSAATTGRARRTRRTE